MQKITCEQPNGQGLYSEPLQLSIQIGSDFFTYTLLEIQSNNLLKLVDCLHVVDVQTELVNLYDKEWVNMPIQQVQVIYHTQKQMSVPSILFDENVMNQQWALLNLTENFQVITREHSDFKFKSIFSVPDSLYYYIQDKWPQTAWFSQYDLHLKPFNPSLETTMGINFKAHGFQILIIQNSQVLFQREFETENENEFAFLIQTTVQNLKLSPELIDVYISGLINESDRSYQLLNNMYKVVSFLNPKGTADQVSILEDYPIHYYSLLTQLVICE